MRDGALAETASLVRVVNCETASQERQGLEPVSLF